eukprot:TRINITY_DN2328_c0_g1_i2.p3 TRINITY_DN2328_c0_g1~~TRINITY_DN2328_c0_g1_i2.p3  ORF type:complete len:175 (-),score=60.46 TRINITY_DN2328_c0_g1_i2:592-1116(-)
MRASLLRDFNTGDLMKPTMKRTVRNLSAVINFAKFREERLDEYQSFTAETDDLLDARAQLEEDTFALNEQLMTLQDQRAREASKVERLNTETEELIETITELNGKQASLQEEIKEMKNATQELALNVQTTKAEVLDTQQEVDMLRSKIIQSPDKMFSRIEKLKVDLSVSVRWMR